MKSLFDAKQPNFADVAAANVVAGNLEHDTNVCEEDVKELTKANAHLQHQINVMDEHCTGW